MFKVEVSDFSNPTIKLLSNIESLLQEQNELLRQAFTFGNTNIVEANKIENKANYDDMGRKELLAIIKTLPKGSIPGKYMTMGIEELREQVKEATKCKEQL
jgi:hypothetical protein